MKKIRKLFSILLLVVGGLALTGCTTQFCSAKDQAAIKAGIKSQLEGTSELTYYTKFNTNEEIVKGIKTSSKKKYTALYNLKSKDAATITWASLEEIEKDAYVDYIYDTQHPKACLTTEEGHIDKTSGAVLEQKTFKFALSGDKIAAKGGLLEILAFPVSWLFVNCAKLISGNNTEIPGWALCIAIMVVTFAIRALVMLLTLKSTKQQGRMQEIQPQLNAIQAKYKDKTDQASKNAMAMETMNLYKKYDINPASSLVAPLITLPIFISVYSAVKDTTVIYEGSLGGLNFGEKLGETILSVVKNPGTSKPWIAIAIFVIMGILQFLTMELPKILAKRKLNEYERKQAKKNNNSQQNMMTYMLLIMVVVIGWILPVGVSVYWLASSTFSIVQTLILDKVNSKPKVKTVKAK